MLFITFNQNSFEMMAVDHSASTLWGEALRSLTGMAVLYVCQYAGVAENGFRTMYM